MADSEPQACEDRRGTHQGAEKQQLRQHLEDFRPGGTERAAVLAPQFICPGPPLVSFTGVRHLTVVCKLLVDTSTV